MSADGAAAAAADAEHQIYTVVDEYCFQSNDNFRQVCFSTLPRLRSAAGVVPPGNNNNNNNRALHLAGSTGDGGNNLMLHEDVVAWRLELDGDEQQPEFFALTRPRPWDGGGGGGGGGGGRGWLRLGKPRAWYGRTAARAVLMTARVLHFFKRNPGATQTALLTHLRQVFGNNLTPRPSENDFRNQTALTLMRQFVATDLVLANSEALQAFIERVSTEDGGADVIDEYCFQGNDPKYGFVCFSTLPLWFGAAAAADVPEGNNTLYLSGRTNRGLWLEGKEVVAWRLELVGRQPWFWVLAPADGGVWLRLAMPKKIYEPTARTVLMTAQALHFLRRHPHAPAVTALWIHLRQVFGKFFPMPSEDDFRNQTSLSLMRQFAAADPVLANSEALQAFVERASTEVGGTDIIDEYCFQAKDPNHGLVCFSTLPFRYGAAVAADVPEGNQMLYLSGRTYRGLWLELKEVVAWRLELDGRQPRFWVLAPADGGGWLRLAMPRKIYEPISRNVLMTAQALHFLKRRPNVPETALWFHLRQAFCNFRPRPSEDDFKNQTSVSLMTQFTAMDPVLVNSGALRAFVERISAEVDGEVINEISVEDARI